MIRDPVAHLARIISLGHLTGMGRLAMSWAYFDETIVNYREGNSGKRYPGEMFVGGCVSTSIKWDHFSRRWRSILDHAGVSVFHAKDFYSFNGEFRWYLSGNEKDFRRHNKFRDKLVDTILDYVDELIIFTSMFPISEKKTRKSYEDAAFRAIFDAIKFKKAEADSLYIVLARHPELSPWSILRRFEQIDWEKKLGGCGVFQPKESPPLQAADLILHSINQRWNGLQEPAFRRLIDGCLARSIPFTQQIASTANIDILLSSPNLNRGDVSA